MGVRLFDHQTKALSKLSNGKILAGDTGSGKSHTAIAYYFERIVGGVLPTDEVSIQTPKKQVPLYIITTAKKRDSLDWQAICSQFGFDPTNSEREGVPDGFNQKIVVDSFNNIRKYKKVTNAFFIFDEQRLSGSGSWSKSFITISQNNGWILLSATPGDKWVDYIPVFIANGFYRNRTEFMGRHVVINSYGGYPKIDRYLEVGTLIKHRRKILVPMPAIRHTVRRRVSLDKQPYVLSDCVRIFKDRWNIFENEPVANASQMFSLLRKVLNGDRRRIETVVELLDEHPKVVIFYNFDYELELLRELETRLDIPVAEWNGHKHEPIPKGNRWVYLVQYTAGNEAWETTETDTMIFYSLNYSFRITHQAEGRIDRLNTPFHILHYYYLSTDYWLDKAIRKAHKDKKAFNERETGITFT